MPVRGTGVTSFSILSNKMHDLSKEVLLCHVLIQLAKQGKCVEKKSFFKRKIRLLSKAVPCAYLYLVPQYHYPENI